MSEVQRWLIQKTPIGTMMKPNPDGNWIAGEDFDRVTAERDALQALLTAADERVNSEVTLRRSHAARIHELNDTNKDLQGRADVLGQALKFYADRDHYSIDDGLNWDSCSGEPANILWHEDQPWFIEDGSIARAALKPAEERNEPNCLRCLDKKTVPSNLAEGYVMDCPDCCGDEG